MYQALLVSWLIALSQASVLTEQYQFESDDFPNFVQGFFVGIGTDTKVSGNSDCYNDIFQAFQFFLEAEKYCKQPPDFWNQYSCFGFIGSTMDQLSKAFFSCLLTAIEDATVTNKVIDQVIYPISKIYNAGKDFLFNSGQISNQSEPTFDYQFKENSYNSGILYGKAFQSILVVDSSSSATFYGFLINLKNNRKAIDFIEGLLKMNQIDLNSFGLSESCVSDMQHLASDVKRLLNNLTSDGLNKIVQHFHKVQTDGNNILKSCSSKNNPLDELAGVFHNFDRFKVFNLIESGKNMLEAQDFEKAGAFFGLAFNTITKNKSETFPNHSDVLQILNGIMHGMASDITIESFQTCTVGEENINYNLYVAINLLKEGTISSVKEALYLLGKSIESLPGMISDCNSTFDQLDALITATKALLSPQSFVFQIGQSLLINGKEINESIEQALNHWQAENWYSFGFNLGHVLKALGES